MGILNRFLNLWRRDRLQADIEAEIRKSVAEAAQFRPLRGVRPVVGPVILDRTAWKVRTFSGAA